MTGSSVMTQDAPLNLLLVKVVTEACQQSGLGLDTGAVYLTCMKMCSDNPEHRDPEQLVRTASRMAKRYRREQFRLQRGWRGRRRALPIFDHPDASDNADPVALAVRQEQRDLIGKYIAELTDDERDLLRTLTDEQPAGQVIRELAVRTGQSTRTLYRRRGELLARLGHCLGVDL